MHIALILEKSRQFFQRITFGFWEAEIYDDRLARNQLLVENPE
jgi:hypothetical protein